MEVPDHAEPDPLANGELMTKEIKVRGTKLTKKEIKVVLKLQETTIPQLLVTDTQFVEDQKSHILESLPGYDEADSSGGGDGQRGMGKADGSRGP